MTKRSTTVAGGTRSAKPKHNKNAEELRSSFVFDDEIAYAVAPPIEKAMEELKE